MENLGKLILVLFASLFIVVILNPEEIRRVFLELYHKQIFPSTTITSFSPLTTKAQEMEFDYIVGSDKGPDKWGDLHKEWAACKYGSLQSPIDLQYQNVEVAPYLGEIQRTYRASRATLKNKGHDIAVEWKGGRAGSVLIYGDRYELQQCHWHSPSEHHFNGRKFALELHMVHKNLQSNKTAVVAVLYNIGQPDLFLSKIKDEIASIADSNKEVDIGMINPNRISTFSRLYYRYMGSLTTPPCTEGVIWTINERVRSVSVEQLKLLRSAVHDGYENNARPLQALNDRDILFYNPYYGSISDM